MYVNLVAVAISFASGRTVQIKLQTSSSTRRMLPVKRGQMAPNHHTNSPKQHNSSKRRKHPQLLQPHASKPHESETWNCGDASMIRRNPWVQNACFGWQLICHGTKLPRKQRKLCSSQLPPSVVFNHFFRQHVPKLETLVLPDSVLQARSKGEQDHHASKSRGTSRDRHSHTTPIFPYEVPCSYGSGIGSVDMGMGVPPIWEGIPGDIPGKQGQHAQTQRLRPCWCCHLGRCHAIDLMARVYISLASSCISPVFVSSLF